MLGRIRRRNHSLAMCARRHSSVGKNVCELCNNAPNRQHQTQDPTNACSDTLLRHARGHESSVGDRQRIAPVMKINSGDGTGNTFTSTPHASEVIGQSMCPQATASVENGQSLPDSSFWHFLGAESPGSIGDVHFADLPLHSLDDLDLNTAASGRWNLEAPSRTPVWLASPTFDLDAINLAMMEPLGGTLSTVPSLSSLEAQHLASVKSSEPPLQRGEIVRRQWFTYLKSADSHHGNANMDTSVEQTEVDEKFRDNLSERLRIRVPFEPLPSTAFLVSLLNSCTAADINGVRIFAYRCTSTASVQHSPSYMQQPFDHQRLVHYSCWQSVQ